MTSSPFQQQSYQIDGSSLILRDVDQLCNNALLFSSTRRVLYLGRSGGQYASCLLVAHDIE